MRLEEQAGKHGGEAREEGRSSCEINSGEEQKIPVANDSAHLPDLELLLSDDMGEVDNVSVADRPSGNAESILGKIGEFEM